MLSRFAVAAGSLSNCPSGAQGGDLGELTAPDCVAEFAREIFGKVEIGVLPRLVHSRFGLHVVEVQARRLDPLSAVREILEQVYGIDDSASADTR